VLPKIESIREYNRVNHRRITLKTNGRGLEKVVPLDQTELADLVTLLKSDPYLPEPIRNQVEGKVLPPTSTLVKYLEDKKKLWGDK